MFCNVNFYTQVTFGLVPPYRLPWRVGRQLTFNFYAGVKKLENKNLPQKRNPRNVTGFRYGDTGCGTSDVAQCAGFWGVGRKSLAKEYQKEYKIITPISAYVFR